MKRIATPNATEDGKFQLGVPGTAQKATEFGDVWPNDVQEEIVSIIEAAGLTPTAGVAQLYRALADLEHRVGDYLVTESSVSPAMRWPWQTWIEVPGRVLVGYDASQTEFNAIGKQGGAKTKTLSINELPVGAAIKPHVGNGGEIDGYSTGAPNADNFDTAGGSQAFSLLPPYRVARVWRRTA
ncbi:phage baseplate protein [Solimonas flava]|uniref:phage baseplate protein n=1 Tax=Solimonas flava TaxID=415849 RepID=UPI0003F55FA1|nr:hypothetical protein [Solimonas flava]